ncbi:MAG: hypothetical protein Q9220_006235 [cf. Caloplaca sp. 1 TL-2023]
MESIDAAVTHLRAQVAQAEALLKSLRLQLTAAEEEQQQRQSSRASNGHSHTEEANAVPTGSPSQQTTPAQARGSYQWPLQPEEYKRYGRQLILEKIGLQGQLNLKNSAVLIVGLGGLGCPAAAYLAGAGVGTIGLVDGDRVETSNLHRQIIHSSLTVGQYKVDSAVQYLKQLNNLPQYKLYHEHLKHQGAVQLFEQYDLILDCTDHPAARYLISDSAVLAGKPLISASALGTEGQLLVLNDALRPYCYRCVFPKPPPPEAVQSCREGGILGPVVGVMGVLMATAALKALPKHWNDTAETQPSMLLYSAYSEPNFRTIKIKGKRESCPSCSNNATITRDSLVSGSLDYVTFCGIRKATEVLSPHQRISASDFAQLRQKNITKLVDVRPAVEYELGHIEGSYNRPLDVISQQMPPDRHLPVADDTQNTTSDIRDLDVADLQRVVFTICRHGNDSQVAAELLQQSLPRHVVCDIQGGLEAWRRDVDPSFPDY